MNKFILITGLTILLGSLYLHQQHSGVYDKYQTFKNQFGFQFTQSEDAYRFNVYQSNLAKIQTHNSDVTQTYQLKETQFMTLTNEEFVSIYLTAKPIEGMAFREIVVDTKNNLKGADWKGITKVKNQGQCGSCWAFSAVGAAESYLHVIKGLDVDLSEQQLVDCESHSYGCNGGYNNYGIEYIAQNGLVTQEEYKYTASQGDCKIKEGTNKVNNVQYVGGDQLQESIAQWPVSVLVDATNWSLYAKGVFNNCGSGVNHAVLGVGFQDDGVWIVKNSWGLTWGEEGHIRLAAGNTCSIMGYAFRAV